MNFQVLSVSFQALKREYFIFAKRGYVWNDKMRVIEMRVKENIGTGIFSQTRRKISIQQFDKK